MMNSLSASRRAALRTAPLILVLVTWLMIAGGQPAYGQRDLKDIPDPDPEIERKSFIVADGFEVNLYASDPLIAKPIQMNFDAAGRLWIASSEVYPHIKPGQQATDKILVVEDKDRDGTAETTTVFADGLLIPTGVIPGDGGAYVANSTELLHLQDTDDDGRADRRRIVLSGFGTEDTHHLLHTLRWGPDGCLYMNQSIYIHSHIETPHGVRRLNGGGIWRFRPETLELDVLCKGFVNPWGHHFDAWGQSFATDGAYREGINYVFPGSVFVSSPGAKRLLTGLNPGSPKHCGLEVVSGRHLPDDFAGNMITNDFRAHRVCRFVVREDGAGYASRQETELIKTSHVAFRPIDVKMGPDGAIYVADWYNPIIQHGEVDFRDERRDHTHGRIWRITAKDRPLVKRVELVGAETESLLDVLKHPEQWNRLHAKLLLKQRGLEAVRTPLAAWLEALDRDDAQFDHHRLEALWLYQALNSVNEGLLLELLQSGDHRVRAAAMRVASDWQPRLRSDALERYRVGVTDPHPRVRLEAVRALAAVPTTEAAQTALLALDRPLDRFLDFALWKTMRELKAHWLPLVQDGSLDFDGRIEHLTFALQAVDSPAIARPLLNLVRGQRVPAERSGQVLTLVATLGGPDELAQLLEMVVDTASDLPAEQRQQLLNAMADSTRQRKVRPAGDLAALAALLTDSDESLRAAAARAAGVWKVESLRQTFNELAGDADEPLRVRLAAVDAIASLGGEASVKELVRISGFADGVEVGQRAINVLATLAPHRAAQLAAARLTKMAAGDDPAAVVGQLLQRKQGPAALAAALDDRQIDTDVAKLLLRVVRGSGQPDQSLIGAIQEAGELNNAGWKLTPELVASLVQEVSERGDPHRGQAIFRRRELQCLKCHAIGGAGGLVGPDLISVGASAQVDYLIEALIEPAKKVKENYHSLVVVTDDGRVTTGIPVRSNDTELVLRDAEDRLVTIRVDSIDEKVDGRSLMPDGAADALTRTELVDLVTFLSRLGKVGEFAVGNARVARRWETLIHTPEAHRRLNRTSFDIAATDDAALSWEPAYSLVSGQLPLAGLPHLKPHRETPPTSFVRCQIEVTTPGEVMISFNSSANLEFWLDSKPTPLREKMKLSLSTGRHTLTFAIDRDHRSDPLRLTLADVPGSAAQAQWVSGK